MSLMMHRSLAAQLKGEPLDILFNSAGVQVGVIKVLVNVRQNRGWK